VQSSHRKNWTFECRWLGIGERPTQRCSASSRVPPTSFATLCSRLGLVCVGAGNCRTTGILRTAVRGGQLGHTTGLL